MDERYLETAERLVADQVDQALAKRRQSAPVKPVDFDGSCAGCGEDVPVARVALGYYNCVGCQAAAEKLRRSR
jgi:RNA polymerase-binding transcription factor DksA